MAEICPFLKIAKNTVTLPPNSNVVYEARIFCEKERQSDIVKQIDNVSNE